MPDYAFMGALSTSASIRRLPQVLATTLAVVGLPILTVSLLRASGTVTSVVLLIAMCTALSIAVSGAGAAFWARRWGAGDTVFDDLMLWGWLRRQRQERQLASAIRLLGLRGDPAADGVPAAQLSSRRKARLLEQLATALEAQLPATHGHSRRVARHAAATAKRMGLSREQVAKIRTAAAIHDVGKVETPLEIINKKGRLTDEEFAVIKRHVLVGARMVAGLGDEELTRAVRHHHERLDGKGYPQGLAGDQIPLAARVIAVADTFDAVTSPRPYRSAMRHKEALELLGAEAGTQLDPHVVRAFRGYYSGLRPVALWTLLLNAPRQLLPSLAGESRFGGMAVAAKATAATVATVAAGGVAIHSLHGDGGSRSQPGVSRFAALPGGGKTVRSHQSGGSSNPDSHGNAGIGVHGNGTPEPSLASPGGTSGPESGGGAPAGESPASEGSGGSGLTPSNGGDGSGSTASGDGSAVPTATLPDTSKATAPVTSVVGAVVETVESVPAGKTVVTTVQSGVPKPPTVGLGGK